MAKPFPLETALEVTDRTSGNKTDDIQVGTELTLSWGGRTKSDANAAYHSGQAKLYVTAVNRLGSATYALGDITGSTDSGVVATGFCQFMFTVQRYPVVQIKRSLGFAEYVDLLNDQSADRYRYP